MVKLEKQLICNEDSFDKKLTKLEKQLSDKKFKCDQCNYEAKTENALKNHTSKKHQQITDVDDNIYPKECALCDIVLNSNKDMKKHMRTHSFNYVTFKCALCDFIGGEQIEMEIHNARLHSEKNECALCDFEGTNLETIDIHLSTCECYACMWTL